MWYDEKPELFSYNYSSATSIDCTTGKIRTVVNAHYGFTENSKRWSHEAFLFHLAWSIPISLTKITVSKDPMKILKPCTDEIIFG